VLYVVVPDIMAPPYFEESEDTAEPLVAV